MRTTKTQLSKKPILTRRLSICLSIATVTVYVFVALWPFRLNPPQWEKNGAVLLADRVVFDEPGIVRSVGALPWINSAIANNDFRLEMRFQSNALNQYGPARIFTISQNTSIRNITVGQEGANLIVRVRSVETTPNGIPEHVFAGVLKSTEPIHLEVDLIQSELNILVNGQTVHRTVSIGDYLSRWNRGFRMALGNELTGERPWLGEITLARLSSGDNRIDLLNSDEMGVPDRYWSGFNWQDIFPSVAEWGLKALIDACLNLVCFVPFGFFVAGVWPNGNPVIRSILFCSLASLSVECSQVFFDNRWPTISDWVLNTSGAAIGSWLAVSGFPVAISAKTES